MTPSGWCATTVRQVAEVAIGRTPARNEKSYWDREKTTQNRWATIADIKRKLIGETSEHISDLGVQRSNARLVPPGTLLMSFKLTLGRAAITSRSMYTNEAIAAFYPNGLADTEYLYYLFPTLALEESSDRAVKGRTLNKAKLRALRLALPPLPEQRKIAAILSSVDDAIEKTQAVIDQVQVVKRGLMQELLTRGLPGRHTQFKKTEIGEIPIVWTVSALDDCASIGNGTTPSKKRREYWDGGTIPWLPTGKVNDRIICSATVCVTEKALRETSLRLLPLGTLLVAMIGQGKTRGKTAYLRMKACVNQNFAYVIPHQEVASWFLFYTLEQQYDTLRASGRGSNQDALNCRIIKRFKVPVPDPDEQAKIAEVLRAVDSRLELEQHRVKLLENAKAALMSVLLTGELRVTP